MEIRLHGRGGQGGVTCAKILAATYARLGKSVQAFGDYAGERSGAPIRAYTRVSDELVINRNKVYEPDHLLVLDPTLLGDAVVAGLKPEGMLLINSSEPLESFEGRFAGYRLAVVDATEIARRHGIGTRSVVIVNTTIAGAAARLLEIPFDVLAETYASMGFPDNVSAAQEAWDAVQARTLAPGEGERAEQQGGVASSPWGATLAGPVPDLVDHREGPAPALKTGAWRSQMPQYIEKLAPCNANCPAGSDVVGFLQALAKGNDQEAGDLLFRTNPLAGVCGRVCPAFCMRGCNRQEYDGAVNVRGLERWLADHVEPVTPEKKTPANKKRIAILGGGPAGLTAAHTFALFGHEPVIFEAEPELGGVLRTGIPRYRLPRDVLDREIDRILALGVEARCGERLDAVAARRLAKEFDAVLFATGLQRLRTVDDAGSDLDGIHQGIRFLHQVNMDQTSPLRGHVVVLGGGNTAMDCARTALRRGAERVTVVYRRTRVEMPAIAEEVDQAEEEGVKLVFQRQPLGFVGNDDGRVTALLLAEVEMGEPDDSGRRRPVVTNRAKEMPCDTVLMALGQSSDFSLLPSESRVQDGRVWVKEQPANIWAAGDLSTTEGTVTHAIGDGRRIATRMLEDLGEEVEVFVRPSAPTVTPREVRFGYFKRAPGAETEHRAPAARVLDFSEVDTGLTSTDEAMRCLSCGHCTQCDTCLVYCPEGIVFRAAEGGYWIDYNYCKGCGMCATECPRCGMEMVAS